METVVDFSADYLPHHSHRFHPRLRHHALQSAVRFWRRMVVLAAKNFSACDNSSHADCIIFRLQFVAWCALVEQNFAVTLIGPRLRRDLDGAAKSF